MNCSSIDLKAFFLGDVDRREKAGCEEHIVHCQSCREELSRLQLTRSALLSLGEEEIPRRIAFVSDRVFEPKWWQSMWRSGPAMGFASAAMLAGAILVHGYTRPAQVAAPLAAVNTARIEQRVELEVSKRMEVVLSKTVADLEKREDAKHRLLLAGAGEKLRLQGRQLVAAEESNRLYQQQMGRMMVAYNNGSGR